MQNMKNDYTDDEKPPPVPRRITNPAYGHQYASGGYNGNYNGYSNMYGSPYQNMMYSNPGVGYRGNYGNENYGPGFEDITANAFQSVGNVIQAFSSVSMMLESMLFATQNSVRALASVADQFRHLRLHVITTAASFLRTLRYYIRKFMVLFHIKKKSQVESEFLEDAFQNTVLRSNENTNFTMVLFYAVVFATPVIMWQLLRKIVSEQGTSSNWYQGTGEHFLAEVKYSFNSENTDELSINSGDVLRIAPKHLQSDVRGWVLASDGEKSGLVPANYIKILGKNRHGGLKKINLSSDIKMDGVAAAAREITNNDLLSEKNLTEINENVTNS